MSRLAVVSLACAAAPAFTSPGTDSPSPGPPNPYCTQPLPFCDLSLSFRQRAEDLISRLSDEEKVSQLSSGLNSVTPAIERLGVEAFAYHSEGLHGLRTTGTIDMHATLFPQVTGLAASNNMTLIRMMGQAMAVEARAAHNTAVGLKKIPGKGCGLSYWSPTMNIIRDPRWGRGQESISEDPTLNGLYAASFVQGFQGTGNKYLYVGATCKHLWAYSLEDSDGYTRHDFNAVVSEQDQQETYLPAFKTCVTKGKPSQIMCSYNAVNGQPTCLHGDMQNGVLREQWGFEGFIVSDCDAIADVYQAHNYTSTAAEATALGLRAGCDLDCGPTYASSAAQAINQKLLNFTTVDTALTRLFLMRMQLGEFDPSTGETELQRLRAYTKKDADTPAHAALAREAAQQAIVLLSNRNQTLPLPKSAALHLAIVGPFGNDTQVLSGGKADYNPSSITTLLQGLLRRQAMGDAGKVEFARGSGVSGSDRSGFKQAEALAAAADVVVLAVGIDSSIESEGHDRQTGIGLPAIQQQLAEAVLNMGTPTIVLLINGGSVSLDSLKVDARVNAIVEAFEGGQAAGDAVGDVLWGDYNPSGAMPYTVYPSEYTAQVNMSDMNMRAGPGRTYRFYTGVPLWPFGFSSSYTSFHLSLSLTSSSRPQPAPLNAPHTPLPLLARASNRWTTQQVASNPVLFTVRVANTGDCAGAKVVQLFIRSLDHSPADAPGGGSLFATAKAHIQAGAHAEVLLQTSVASDLCTFCAVAHGDGSRQVRGGRYEVWAGPPIPMALLLARQQAHAGSDAAAAAATAAAGFGTLLATVALVGADVQVERL